MNFASTLCLSWHPLADLAAYNTETQCFSCDLMQYNVDNIVNIRQIRINNEQVDGWIKSTEDWKTDVKIFVQFLVGNCVNAVTRIRRANGPFFGLPLDLYSFHSLRTRASS